MTASHHILIVDDEVAIRDMVGLALQQAGMTFDKAASAHEARAMLEDTRPDLILLDWMMPGLSGVDWLRDLRRNQAADPVPVIMVTARTEEEDLVRGLDAGADDYITKPFSTNELLARIRAVLRRQCAEGETDRIEVGELIMDVGAHRVWSGEQELELGPTEYRLLHFFMSNRNRVFSRTQILDSVWGTNKYIEERTVDVHIRRLRKGLESIGQHELVQTVRGAGYRFGVEKNAG
ncbi:MAG: phosphate regulon transcriptional regulator PhoB [Proteobacteria bacterium]|nr:phosphate regulon transcriptional regulator PhoB [Pseudomonadota bacterium]